MDDFKERRIEARLTQRGLAERVGSRAEYIGRIERGQMVASEDLAYRIERALGGRRLAPERNEEEQWWHDHWCKEWG